jgi:soluble lytic murein transglycosylase
VLGDGRAAVEAYRQAFYLYPNTGEAEEAGREIERLSRQLSGGVSPASAFLRCERAERLFEARTYGEAEKAYRELAAAVTGAERDRALVRAAAAAFRAGRISAAYSALSGLHPADPAADAERMFLLAECYRRMSREESFVATVAALGERYPDSPWHEEALFSAGNYFLVGKDAPRYESYYRALYERFPAGNYAALAHWRVGWRRYMAGDADAARQLFEEQVLRYAQSQQAPAALYWLGRLAEPRDRAVAAAYYRKASDNFPNYFYGTLARQKLSELGGVPAGALPNRALAVLAAAPSYRPALLNVMPPADRPMAERMGKN